MNKQALPQLMRLFRTAGLLETQEWRQYAESQEKHKHIVDVLQQNVSVSSFKDLLTAEISFKAPRNKDIDENLYEGLMTSGMIQDQELMQLLSIHQPPIDQLLQALSEDGAIEADVSATLKSAYSDENLAEFYQNLVRENYLNGSIVSRWLRHPQANAIRRMALYQCIQLVYQSGRMSAEDMNAVVDQLDRQDCEFICNILRKEADLGSARVFEMIQGGLTLPSIRLNDMDINPVLFNLIPLSLIRRQMIIPFFSNDTSIGIATSDPLHTALAALLHWVTGLWPQMTLAGGQSIIDKINYFQDPEYRTSKGSNESSVRLKPPPLTEKHGPNPGGDPSVRTSSSGRKSEEGAKAPAEEARPTKHSTGSQGHILTDNVSAVQLVSSLIESAIQLRTTDIHLEPSASGLTVRFRIDGELHRILVVPTTLSQPVTSRIKVLADMDVTERRRPQDGHFELKLEERNFDFRISTLPAILGEKVVIRILDTTRVLTGMESLGLLPSQMELVNRMIAHPHGLILVTGPTGSGKTTTLYSALNELNNENRNLVTIEDPVEYQLEGINQVQVDTHIDLTFSEGLRSILRQDPDIIMVGEIRDSDTASITMRAAMTGHLVFSTLHTNTAIGAVEALTNLGAVPFMIAGSLLGIISQRLLRALCEDCRKGKMLNSEHRQQLELSNDTPKKKIYLPGGCDTCLGSGYLGRTGAYEVILITEGLRPLIAAGQNSASALEAAVREQGMISLFEAARKKVLMGETSIEEISNKIMLDI